ncbi:MAG: hypothetical protein DME59_00265 [Verrucomicrobia bacterium]|nr:MAG: hypothetical protein DME59_00265 [Verrucomicrobiota bacterium]PYL73123.1 MAG: hypothetical protein DMF26_14875 [Verrucomicrobiota bacterium]
MADSTASRSQTHRADSRFRGVKWLGRYHQRHWYPRCLQKVGGKLTHYLPDHKLYMLSLDDENEAHYVCAVLNSRQVRRILGGFLVGKQIGTTIFRYTGIKSYDATDRRHRELATISRRAHRSPANTRNSDDLVAEEQSRLDELVLAVQGD